MYLLFVHFVSIKNADATVSLLAWCIFDGENLMVGGLIARSWKAEWARIDTFLFNTQPG